MVKYGVDLRINLFLPNKSIQNKGRKPPVWLKLYVKGLLLMRKEHRLRQRSDFRRVFRCGKSVANRQFVLYSYARKDNGPVRIGISVSKKVGNAVVRNRIRRRVKEVVRQWTEQLPEQNDFIIIARRPAAEMDYKQIQSSLRHVFNKGNAFRKQETKAGKYREYQK